MFLGSNLVKKLTNRLLISVLLLNTGLYASDDDAAIRHDTHSFMNSRVVDYSNMNVVSREINHVSSWIQGKQRALQDLVDLSNGRKSKTPATIKRDVKAIAARNRNCKEMADERVAAYDTNAAAYNVLANEKTQIFGDILCLAQSMERLADIAIAEEREGLSPEMNDLKSQITKSFEQGIKLDALQREKVDTAKTLLDLKAFKAQMPASSTFVHSTHFNRPGNKMRIKLALQKEQEAYYSLVASANSDEMPEELKPTFLEASRALSEQRPAAAAAQSELFLGRPKGLELLTAEEFLRYTTLQKQLRPLKRHANFLSRVFQDLMLRSEVKKSKQPAVQKPSPKTINKAKLTREKNAEDAKKEAELKAHEQAQASIEKQKEQEETRQQNAARRALRQEQNLEPQREEVRVVVVAEPETLYLPYCVETESFNRTFEDMNERTQNALEAVVSDLMLGGKTVRSRGVIQGIMCIVNGKELRIGHADYLGPKNRLFYAIFKSHLILLQAGSHDFDLTNRIVTL